MIFHWIQWQWSFFTFWLSYANNDWNLFILKHPCTFISADVFTNKIAWKYLCSSKFSVFPQSVSLQSCKPVGYTRGRSRIYSAAFSYFTKRWHGMLKWLMTYTWCFLISIGTVSCSLRVDKSLLLPLSFCFFVCENV